MHVASSIQLCTAALHSFWVAMTALHEPELFVIIEGTAQHSLSVHVDKEQVIDPGLDFNEPEAQL